MPKKTGFSRKKPQQGAPTLLRPIFRTEKSRSLYHAKPAEHTPSEQVSWLVHHGYFPGLLRAERSNDRLSPNEKYLRTYSGGTAGDFHPVRYSPTGLLPLPWALRRYPIAFILP